jgi:Down syndrome cell adhesion molecule
MFGTRFTATSGNSKLFPTEKIAQHKHLFSSIRCLPQFTWLLDSQPILDVTSLHRYAMGQYVDISGDVISHLNISHVRTDDGGLYKCIATNSVGFVSHAARLNIFGPPYVRAISPIKAIANEDLVVFCPFSGYPIDSIRWEKAGIEITSSEMKTRARPMSFI